MEKALMKVTKDIRLGKILIQTNDHGEPMLHYCRLPMNKAKDFVGKFNPFQNSKNILNLNMLLLSSHGSDRWNGKRINDGDSSFTRS